MLRGFLGSGCLAFALGLALPAAADQISIAQRIAAEYAAPRYQKLADSTERQASLWKQECAAPAKGTTDKLQISFAQSVLDWQDIALFRFGPISEQNRIERIAFWPDKRNMTEKRLRELLRASDAAPDAASMPKKSVAIQGFPALERLLFDEGPAAFDTPEGARRCAVGAVIAGNIATIAADAASPWNDSASPLRKKIAGREGAEELLRRAATDLIAGYEFIMDEKIRGPIGRTLDKAKPLSAELRRSGLSLEALRRNLQALRDLSDLMLAGTDDQVVDDTVAEALKVAKAAPDDALQAIDDRAKRGKMLLLIATITSARDVARDTIPAALGVSVGFNSADGD